MSYLKQLVWLLLLIGVGFSSLFLFRFFMTPDGWWIKSDS